MRSSITIGAEYLLHTGGTKYYEIASFLNDETSQFVEVRRWGPMSTAASGGGQTQVLTHLTAERALESVRKQLRAKRAKGYEDKPYGKFGLHSHAGRQSLGDAYRLIGEHYADAELVDQVRIASSVAGAPSAPIEPQPPKVVKPEPDRGAQWGSW